MNRIVTAIEFDAEIPCSLDLLNARFPLNFDNFSGHIIFPGTEQGASKNTTSLIHQYEKKLNADFGLNNWGNLRKDQEKFWPRGLVFDFTFNNIKRDLIEKKETHLALQKFQGWLKRFEYAVEIFLLTKLRFQKENCQKLQLIVELDENSNCLNSQTIYNYPISFVVLDGVRLEEAICEKCIFAATTLQQPTTEFKILRESFINFADGDFRSSIIEAGTAVEICLTKLLTEKIGKKLSPDEIEKLLKKFHSLSGRIQLAKVFDISLNEWNDFKEIQGPRNKAVHAGRTPTRIELENCLKLSKSFLKKNSKEFSNKVM